MADLHKLHVLWIEAYALLESDCAVELSGEAVDDVLSAGVGGGVDVSYYC